MIDVPPIFSFFVFLVVCFDHNVVVTCYLTAETIDIKGKSIETSKSCYCCFCCCSLPNPNQSPWSNDDDLAVCDWRIGFDWMMNPAKQQNQENQKNNVTLPTSNNKQKRTYRKEYREFKAFQNNINQPNNIKDWQQKNLEFYFFFSKILEPAKKKKKLGSFFLARWLWISVCMCVYFECVNHKYQISSFHFYWFTGWLVFFSPFYTFPLQRGKKCFFFIRAPTSLHLHCIGFYL